ncbi:ATP-binding cassette domain-containing protein [Amycolatopsis methanolica]|uniref:ATP-binding cassette domain-containing protein n=1 Tax=Amycolatopsis methanolica TaxID=1814 RepID=UPI0003AA3F47|nr:ATP-binding cassette domain-containing protein [Amycolatopsis methanolica]
MSASSSRAGSLALIGDSGSGKSTIARSLLRLLPEGGRARGVAEFDGQDVLSLPERRFRRLRGRRIGHVPQDPGSSLNPVRTIGAQAREAAALLDEPSAARRHERILETFAQVGLDDPRRVDRRGARRLPGRAQGRRGAGRGAHHGGVLLAGVGLHTAPARRRPGAQPGPLPPAT